MTIILKLDKLMKEQKISLNAICNILDCQPGDILEYVRDKSND